MDDPDNIKEEQKVQHDEQQLQAIRQTEQGLRQDQQGTRQDQGQEQQTLTDKITTAHTEKLLEVENRQTKSDKSLDQIIDGVDFLSGQVETLNERVYTKNYLDRLRNFLLLGFIIVFLFVSSVLGVLIVNQKHAAEDRAREAELGRRQIADCTVKPGTMLDDGYVNPGNCYTESSNRTAEAIGKLTVDIQEGVRQLLLIQAEAVAANQTLSEDVRSFARQQVAALHNFVPKKDTKKP